MDIQETSTLTAGTIIGGRYQIVREIAQGGMGAVYEAADTRLTNRRCALKVLRDAGMSVEDRAEAATWFTREARILSTLRHPLIPTISDYFSSDGRHILVMDLIEGETLEQVLAHEGTPGLPVDDVTAWGSQLCAVLHYLHTRQPPVIFRDLKPANVMRQPGGALKLIDFGIARILEPKHTGQTIHTMIGTPGYSPPEQYQGLADPRSDVYSLGATLHHIFTGRDPRKYQPFVFPPLSENLPEIDPAVEDAIDKAVMMLARDRFATAKEFERALSHRTPIDAASWVAPSLLPLPAFLPVNPMPVVPVSHPQPETGRDISVLTDKLHWPAACACCCGAADTHLPVTYYRGEGTQVRALSWQVPYCATCQRHAASYHKVGWNGWKTPFVTITWVILVLLLAGSLELPATMFPVTMLVMSTCPVIILVWRQWRIEAARALMRSICGDVGYPVVYQDSAPAYQFHFTNKAYAGMFEQANHEYLL